MQDAAEPQDVNDLMLRRREELEELRRRGIDPYPPAFDVTSSARNILETFDEASEPRTVRIAGRVMTLRRMGKASFCHIQDGTGRLQLYLKKDFLLAFCSISSTFLIKNL